MKLTVIARHDVDLACQIRRLIGLDAAEGLLARGGNRSVRPASARNSRRETILGLRIADAVGYLEAKRALREADAVDRIVAISAQNVAPAWLNSLALPSAARRILPAKVAFDIRPCLQGMAALCCSRTMRVRRSITAPTDSP